MELKYKVQGKEKIAKTKCGIQAICKSCKPKEIIKEFEKVGQANFGSKGK